MGRLDEILRAQPATLPPPSPVRHSKRFDYTGYMQRHPVAQVAADTMTDQLGAEFFDPEQAPPRAPQIVPEGMHMTSELAKSLKRSSRTIRHWIDTGIIPDAPMRTKGGTHEAGLGTTTTAKRLWPAEEINAIIEIARSEGIIENTRAAWNENNFQQRVWDAITEIRRAGHAPTA
jgi:hypothetical protein